MKRILIRLTLVVVPALLALYIGDNLVMRYRIHAYGTPFGAVQVKRYLAIRHKDQRVEFVRGDSDTRPCANSLFPQFGMPPCWYLSRHAEERVDM